MFNSDTTGDLSSHTLSPRISRETKAKKSYGKLQRRAVPQIPAIKGKIAEKTKAVKKEFASVEHLSVDAVGMFIDNELTTGAMHRARLHIVHCGECREEIKRQRETVDYVRTECLNKDMSAPMDLKAKLASLANECSPGPGAEDVAMQRPASFVAKVESVVRAVRRTQGR